MATNGEVDHCLELLCQKGCRSVWEGIAMLERGEQLPETASLESDDRERVLNELKAIMEVYEGSCCSE